jgi:flagellar motor switch protein FliG
MEATTHNLTNIGMRKAAILVACLDRAAADAVLEQLGPEQAQRVRQAVVVLDEIPDDEQQRIIDEFFQRKPLIPSPEPSGIDLGNPLTRETVASRFASESLKMPTGPTPAKPFIRLREAEGDKLARLLAGERPQTIALVLSHLSSRQAGAVLTRLPGGLQAEVIKRLVELEETDPAILREVEQALESRLSQQISMQRQRVAGLQALSGILQASDSGVRLQILNNLAARDQALAQRIIPRPMDFDELADLDDFTLAEVFRAVEPQWIMPALLGALPDITERVLNFLPRGQAQSLRRKLQQPGPIRLSDVEAARRRIAEIAARLMFAKKQTLLGAA